MVEGTQRRLAAIVSADVVGYSRLMGADEIGTLAALNAHRSELIDLLVAKHGGRIVKTTGDGLLLEFPSIVTAVECSVAVQNGMTERNAAVEDNEALRFRVGVHLGDIIVEGDDIFGDGVNVAARLEGLSEPNGLALSDDAYRQVRDRMDIDWQDGGEHEVKNIVRPVHVWRWSPRSALETVHDAAGPLGGNSPLSLPDKPSIAVLPFDNMSGDPEQEFFADGIAEDVITALSRFSSLFVIARNSSFTYKGQAVDIAKVGRDLGVRYVVEGSVRKAGNRVRITAQLIDAASGNHLWADRFDGALDDVFDLQDQITEKIIVAVAPEVEARERDRARRKQPNNLDAWGFLQRGLSHSYRLNKTDNDEAIRLFREAIVLDPRFAAAHAHLAYAVWSTISFGFTEDIAEAAAGARSMAETAVTLDANEPMAHLALGRTYLLTSEIEMALAENHKAIAINANFARGHHGLGFAYYYGAGQAESALPHFDAALRLSPRDPWRWITLMVKGSALRFLGRYDAAIEHCQQACLSTDGGHLPLLNLAAALAVAGRKNEASLAVVRAMQIRPSFTISDFRNRLVGMNEVCLDHYASSLRKAGVPE